MTTPAVEARRITQEVSFAAVAESYGRVMIMHAVGTRRITQGVNCVVEGR